jgi:urease accessory protein
MRSSNILPAGSWDAARAVDRVLLDFDHRHRRRLLLRTVGEAEVLLDLPHAVRLHDGDGLVLDDGRVIRVTAEPEILAEISTDDPDKLAGIAWHLGNRHLPMQVSHSRIRIRADHVIEAMVAALGGHVEHVQMPFEPEAGAYTGGHHHHHGCEHDC